MTFSLDNITIVANRTTSHKATRLVLLDLLCLPWWCMLFLDKTEISTFVTGA